jgi:hypothetical protein
LTDYSELELGGSYAQGAAQGFINPGYGQAVLTGADISYRRFWEGQRRLLLRAETVQREEIVDSAGHTVNGYYFLANYRPNFSNNFGLLYDWSEFPQTLNQHESAVSLILTHQFSEQYYLRLQATHGSRPGDSSYNELWLQWVWGVGPHTHNLE